LVGRSWVGGWVGGWVRIIYYLHFYIYKLSYFLINFFGLPNFLYDLTSQKNYLMVS
jgi:hypothetical protein